MRDATKSRTFSADHEARRCATSRTHRVRLCPVRERRASQSDNIELMATDEELKKALKAFTEMQPQADGPRHDEALYHQARILAQLGALTDLLTGCCPPE